MRFYKNIITGLLLSIILIIGCRKVVQENPPLAKYDGGEITQNEYIDLYLFSTLYKPEVFPTNKNLREYVARLGIEELIVREAKFRNIDQEPEFQQKLKKKAAQNLYFQYMRKEIIDSVITDSLINKYYNEFTPQYRLAYIMRPFLEDSPDDFVKSQKDSIEFIYKLLKAGEDFAELAKKYSQDVSSNKKGGDLGFVTRESMGDAQIRAVMDTLKEFSYSKPFRGYNGYYILKKGETREVPVPPIEEARGKIWEALYRTRSHEIRMAEKKRFNWLAPRYNFQIHEDVIEQIKNKVGGRNKSEYADVNFALLTEEDLAKELASFKGGSILVSELFEGRRRKPVTMFEFKDELTKKSKLHILALHARELNMRDLPEAAKQIKEMEDDLLKTYILKREIKDKAQARLDSLNKQPRGSEIQESLRKQRFDHERDLELKLEEDLNEKYNFRFIPENFDQALSEASKRKEKQNKEREEKKSQ